MEQFHSEVAIYVKSVQETERNGSVVHSLFQEQLAGQRVALGPALQTAVHHHAFVLTALQFTGQLL